ncbi:unnamed protein product [Discula destructiva]
MENFSSSASKHHGRTFVAYFYSVDMAKTEQSQLFNAITAIVSQLTAQDELFQQHVINKIGLPTAFSEDFWWKTLTEFKPRTQTTYFLVLDGFSKSRADEALWKRVIQDCAMSSQDQVETTKPAPVYIRLFLTGSESFLNQVLKDYLNSVRRLRIYGSNDNDVQLYLEHSLREVYGNGDYDRVLKRIRELLPKLPRDYLELIKLKRNIKQQNYEENVMELLEEAARAQTHGRDYNTRNLLRNLNRDLCDDRIRNLNEMLPWIVLPYRWPRMQEIETVLMLRTGKTSIVPLSDMISNDEYGTDLLSTDGQFLRSRRLLNYFENENRDSDEPAKGEVTMPHSAQDGLHESEMAIIQALVKSVCPADLWKRLKLEEFLESKLSSPTHPATSNQFQPR